MRPPKTNMGIRPPATIDLEALLAVKPDNRAQDGIKENDRSDRLRD